MKRTGFLMGLSVAAWCSWWVVEVLVDFTKVSPVHWHLLFPKLAVDLVPAAAAMVAATLFMMNKRGAFVALLVFLGAYAQARTVTFLAPEILTRYEDTLQETYVEIRATKVS